MDRAEDCSEPSGVEELDPADVETILAVINDAARDYEGVIPPESYSDPYMDRAELADELATMAVYGVERDGRLVGVMGLQSVDDVTLIRHLYVRRAHQRQGIGSQLLAAGIRQTTTWPLLVGTWAAADWAIRFYEANGFECLGNDRERLDQYWNVPEPHAAASVVLRYADESGGRA